MVNSRTLVVSLVVIIVAAIVFFNLERFVGEATKETATKLYVSSKAGVMSETNPTIKPGTYVYFTEMPGKKGGSGTLYIRSMTDERKWGPIVRTQVFQNCNANKCNPSQVGTLNFKTYYGWKGKYCGEVKDLTTWKTTTACFTVP
ncbi:MAG: hypothetical protein Q8N77_04520 [Nanoarchaeota archaeon]|nr:hypothetical protein [Nanoarchaeota archaeon]